MWAMPHLDRIWVRIWWVEPKTAREARMWSPLRNKAAILAKTAAMPEEVATPSAAPSRAQTLATSSSVFGLLYRE